MAKFFTWMLIKKLRQWSKINFENFFKKQKSFSCRWDWFSWDPSFKKIKPIRAFVTSVSLDKIKLNLKNVKYFRYDLRELVIVIN